MSQPILTARPKRPISIRDLIRQTLGFPGSVKVNLQSETCRFDLFVRVDGHAAVSLTSTLGRAAPLGELNLSRSQIPRET